VSGSAHDPGSLPPVLSEEERAFRASLGRLVDWYRLRQWPALSRALLAVVLLPVGNVLVAISMARPSLDESTRLSLTILGLLVIASGPLWAIWQLYRAIRSDLYVAIRLDGLGVRLDPEREEALYAWDRVVEVRHDSAAKCLRIELEDGAPLTLRGAFEGVSLDELGQRIRDARRLGVWNRLIPRYPPTSE
jgi:hypothetical protein